MFSFIPVFYKNNCGIVLGFIFIYLLVLFVCLSIQKYISFNKKILLFLYRNFSKNKNVVCKICKHKSVYK